MAAMAQEFASDLERRLALAQRELSEAREQQAATAEVLAGHLEFARQAGACVRAILANATRLCEAKFGNYSFLRMMPFIRSRCMRRVSSSG